MVESLIKSLVLTLIIELIVALLLGIRHKDDIRVIICANIITNPVVVYVSNIILMFRNEVLYFLIVAILELLALLVEWSVYKKYLIYDKVSPLVIALVSNAVSFGMGLMINYII